MKKPTILFCFALSFLAFFANCSQTIEGDLILKNAHVVDVKTGNIINNVDVVINTDTIASIVKHERNSEYISEQVVDATDKFLIPGLWDMHVHTWWAYEDFFPLLIANGVTGVREMFGDLETVTQIRSKIEEGKIIGPMIISSGPIVDGDPPAWPGSDAAATPERGREIVRKQKEAGADYIKVYSFLDRETYFAIADECKKLGITFSGHIPRAVKLEEAVEAGQHSAEHFNGIIQFTSSKRDHYYAYLREEVKDSSLNSWLKRLVYITNSFDENRVDSLTTLLSNANFWVNPTSTVNRSFAYINDPEFRDDDRIYYMPSYTTYNWDPTVDFRLKDRTDESYQIERNWYHLGLSIMKPMLDGGTKFLAGTDFPNPYTYPGFSLHDELDIFVNEANFTPLEALQTATINPAIFLEKEDELGSVETGKVANLVLLNKNPLDNIANTKSIEAVMINGKYLKGTDLRAGIDAIANKNKLPNIWEKLKALIEKKGIDNAVIEYHKLKSKDFNAYNFDEEQLNTLGYELMESGKIKEAVKIFELNIEVYPDYLNGYDSLGDGYLAAGEKEYAVKAWEQAVAKGLLATKPKLEQLKEELN